MPDPEPCKCNCHQDWWESEPCKDCDTCLMNMVQSEREMTVTEIRGGLRALSHDWRGNGFPVDIEKVLADAEKSFE